MPAAPKFEVRDELNYNRSYSPNAKNTYRAFGFSTAATMMRETVDIQAMTIICLGRSFRKSDEKQQTRTMTRATQSKMFC